MTSGRAGELARGWIEAWIRMDMEWLRTHLAEDFVHVSPLGRLEGRASYLNIVEPMARKSVMTLTIHDVVVADDRAAIWFDNETPNGVVPSCDWVWVDGDLITEVRSFYDPTAVRRALSASEREKLSGKGEED